MMLVEQIRKKSWQSVQRRSCSVGGLAVGAILLASSVTGQLRADSGGLECVAQMQLPLALDPLAGEPIGDVEKIQIGPAGGSTAITERNAKVEITIGPKGTIADVQVTGSAKGRLNLDLAKHFRAHLTPEVTCAGKTIEFGFIFRVGGTIRKTPTTTVMFRPPNRFIIEQEPGAAIVDSIPLRR